VPSAKISRIVTTAAQLDDATSKQTALKGC